MNETECDHDDTVQFGLLEVTEESEYQCDWCDFDRVDVGVMKDNVHWLWLCDECRIDIEMYAMNGGLRYE